MKFIILILITLFTIESAYANCELSWVKEWESDKNWLHTSAIYSNQIKDSEFKRPQIRNIRNENSQNQINLQCISYSISSCKKIVSLKLEGDACTVDQDSMTFTEGQTNQATGEVEVYARAHINNCFQKSIASEIAIMNNDENLVIPDRYPLAKEGKEIAEIFLKENIDQIRGIEGLKEIQVGSGAPLDVQNGEFSAKNIYKDKLENFVLHMEAKISKGKDGKLCSGCTSSSGTKNLPILVGYFNSEWFLIGNGAIGWCAAYFNNMNHADDWGSLDIPFGLPSEYISYDSNRDKKIDLISLTPRSHLPGTKQIYSLFDNKLISVDEICTIPDKCRPEAGC